MPDYLKEAFDYYLGNQESFVRKYEGKVIVLKDRVVLGVYDEEIDAINETMKTEPLGTFLVQKVTPGTEAYTVTIHRAVFPLVQQPSYSFTVTSLRGRLDVLKSWCRVAEAAENFSAREVEFEGLWDTGATKSVITQAVVDACGLTPTGRVQVSSVGGLSESETYVVNFVLPNQIRVRNVRVAKGALVGTNVLIGMDIIGLGDFAVTNHQDVTKFSFRVPSLAHIDFVEEAKRR